MEVSFEPSSASADLCTAIDTFINALMKLYLVQLELECELATCEMIGWEC